MKELPTVASQTINVTTEFDALLTIAKKVTDLKNEFENLSLGNVCDGIYANNFAEAQSRLEAILNDDLAQPMHISALEKFINRKAVAL